MSRMPPAAAFAGTPPRLLLVPWAGQLLSMLSVAMANFGLGVWVYQHSGSITQFTSVILFAILPGVLAAPWAGVVVDRHDKRRVIVVADAVLLAGVAAVSMFLWRDAASLWHLYAFNTLASLCGAFRNPAYFAAMTALVHKDLLARCSGFMRLAGSMAEIAAPFLAGFLLHRIGLPALLAICAPATVLALVTLAVVRMAPAPVRDAPAGDGAAPSRRRELMAAVTYLRERPGLPLLSGYSAVQHFCLAMATTLLTPLVLASHTAADLGTVLSAGGVGATLGSLLMIALARPGRLMPVMLLCDFIFAVTLALAGVVRTVPALAAMVFASMLCVPIISSCGQAIWQRKVRPDLQGRVFSLNSMLVTASIPLAALAGSALADRLFEPWLMPGGPLAGSVGTWLGIGKGRGVAFVYVVAGSMAALLTLLAVSRPTFRQLDRRLPDAH